MNAPCPCCGYCPHCGRRNNGLGYGQYPWIQYQGLNAQVMGMTPPHLQNLGNANATTNGECQCHR